MTAEMRHKFCEHGSAVIDRRYRRSSVTVVTTWLPVDSIRSREPSPCGIASDDSIFLVPNEEDSTPLRFVQDDDLFKGS